MRLKTYRMLRKRIVVVCMTRKYPNEEDNILYHTSSHRIEKVVKVVSNENDGLGSWKGVLWGGLW